MAWWRRSGPFVPLGDGRVALKLGEDEREVLGHLLPQLGGVLDDPDHPDVRRLFPTAYPNDAERDADYQRFMRDELATSRSVSLQTVLDTLGNTELSSDELSAWLQTLNAARLVLGTRLDVSEDDGPPWELDPDDPDTPTQVAYLWMSELLETATRAAMSGLD
jgi:hypothetical protein